MPAGNALNLFFQQERAGLSFRVVVAPLLAFVAIISFSQTGSVDLWWHLKTGEWIWRQHAIPSTDPFSFSAAGQPWIAHEWLFGVLAFLVHQAAGLTGLAVMKSLSVAGLLALAAWTARVRDASAAMTTLVLAACYAVARLRFAERPELISLPIAMTFLLVYEKSREKPRLLLLLPALQLLWVNVHGGTAVLGWGLAGSFLIDRAWQLRRQGTAWQRIPFHTDLTWRLWTLVAVIAVSFLNPAAYRTLAYGILRAESPLNIQEFRSFGANVALGFDLATGLFIAFAAATAALFALRPRSVRTYEWLLFSALLILAAFFFRFRSLFVFLLAPSLAWQLSRGKWLGRLRWWLPALATLALLARVAAIERNSYTYRFGAGIHTGILPVEAAEFVMKSGLKGRMFNSYGFGGYFIWRLGPETRVFIDGREDVYVKPGIAADYSNAFQSAQSWQELVSRYGFDYAVITYPEQPPSSPQASLDALAFPRSGWALVYFDDLAVIYVRRNGTNEGVIRQNEIKLIQPLQLSGYLDGIIRDPAAQRQFLEEMGANLREHPASFRAHFLMGMFSVKQGQDFAQAIREFQLASAVNPEYVPAYLNLGAIYLGLGRLTEARQAYARVLGIENNPTAAQQLKRIQGMR